jgi:hypothetical protein
MLHRAGNGKSPLGQTYRPKARGGWTTGWVSSLCSRWRTGAIQKTRSKTYHLNSIHSSLNGSPQVFMLALLRSSSSRPYRVHCIVTELSRTNRHSRCGNTAFAVLLVVTCHTGQKANHDNTGNTLKTTICSRARAMEDGHILSVLHNPTEIKQLLSQSLQVKATGLRPQRPPQHMQHGSHNAAQTARMRA